MAECTTFPTAQMSARIAAGNINEQIMLRAQESAEDREAALRFGLMSDAEAEWQHRFRQLVGYHGKHADAHVGFRDGDDRKYPDLGRWAAKQRAAWKTRSLSPHR